MGTIRDSFIAGLRDVVNEREGTEFTFDDVETYVGSETDTNDIMIWLEDTISGESPVTAEDIEGVLD